MDIQMSQGAGLDPIRGQIEKKSNGEVEAPNHIIKTRSAAYSLYSMVRSQNLERFALWAAIEGLIAGNPPYDQEDLDKHGLSHMTNYNDLSASARFEKECLAYFNLLHNAEILVNFHIYNADPEAETWAQTMSINLDRTLRSWRNFNTMMGTNAAQLAKFGYSPLIWPDERDWRPRVTEIQRFLIHDQQLCDLDQLTYCFFENDFTAQYLFQVYDEIKKKKTVDKQTGEVPGEYKYFWNEEALADLLLYRANHIAKPANAGWTTFMDLQVALQNGDYTYDQVFSDGIRLITLLYKEYDGKISHYMFDPVWSARNDFLFLADRQYHDFSQACAIFTRSPAHFTVHSNRGIGHKVFSPCQAKNQLACSLVDMARYSSTPMLRNNAGSIKDPQQIRMFPGVPTDIGAAEFVQNNLGNNIQQVIGALQFLDANLSVNLGISGDDPQFPDSSNASVSPSQARQQSYREFNILSDRVAHYYNQLDFVYSNIVAIMLRSKKGDNGFEYAEKWKRMCIAEGVPEEMFDLGNVEWGLPDHLCVKATRVAGAGSTVGLIMGLEFVGQMIGGDLSPKASKRFKRDVIIAGLGPDQVNGYTDGDQDPDEISGGASLAGVENIGMQQGFSPVWDASNEHKTHFAIHMALNIQTMQQVQQQQATPIDAQKIFDHSIEHTDAHWKFILKSPFGKSFVNKWQKPWEEIKKYAELNKKNAIKMYEAQIKQKQADAEATQQVMSDAQRKDFVAQTDAQRKDRESEHKIQQKDKETETRGELKRKEIEIKADNDRLKASLDHSVKSQKQQGELSLEQTRIELDNLTRVDTPNESF